MPKDSKRVFWGLRTFCLITGASRGIGQEMAFQFAKKFKSGSVMVLLSRTVSGLEATKKKIEASSPGIKVKTMPTDLYKPNNEEYYNIIVDALKDFKAKASDFEHALIVHNAGVMMMGTSTVTVDDLKKLHDDINVNLYSTISLNVQFLKVFHKDTAAKRTVIQTSSIASVMPVPGSGFYCMAKAARNMYFKTLAVDDPTLDVFSYGPGPVDTDLARSSGNDIDPEDIEKFRKTGYLLTCDKTVDYLVKLLTDGDYESGEFKDIYQGDEYMKLFGLFAEMTQKIKA